MIVERRGNKLETKPWGRHFQLILTGGTKPQVLTLRTQKQATEFLIKIGYWLNLWQKNIGDSYPQEFVFDDGTRGSLNFMGSNIESPYSICWENSGASLYLVTAQVRELSETISEHFGVHEHRPEVR